MNSSRHTFFGRLLRGAAIVLALSGALSAQDWWARFGVQGSHVTPTGDFLLEQGFSTYVKPGFGIGIFWEVPATDNLYHVVALQATDLGYASDNAPVWSLSYDMQYYLQPSWQIGLYGLVGVSYMRANAFMHVIDRNGYPGEEYVNNFGLNLGVGHYFTRHIGAEAKCVFGTDSWSYMQFSAKLRF